jgi:hypothetical protein
MHDRRSFPLCDLPQPVPIKTGLRADADASVQRSIAMLPELGKTNPGGAFVVERNIKQLIPSSAPHDGVSGQVCTRTRVLVIKDPDRSVPPHGHPSVGLDALIPDDQASARWTPDWIIHENRRVDALAVLKQVLPHLVLALTRRAA